MAVDYYQSFHQAWANYYVKFIDSYQEGIPVWD
jgi:hypothetical protein